jgi:hypothetical protein
MKDKGLVLQLVGVAFVAGFVLAALLLLRFGGKLTKIEVGGVEIEMPTDHPPATIGAPQSEAQPTAAPQLDDDRIESWEVIATSIPEGKLNLDSFEVRMTVDPSRVGVFDLVGQVGTDPVAWDGRVFVRLDFYDPSKGVFNIEFFDSREGGQEWTTDHVTYLHLPPDGIISVRVTKGTNGRQSIQVFDSAGHLIGDTVLPTDGFPDGVRFFEEINPSKFAILIPPGSN